MVALSPSSCIAQAARDYPELIQGFERFRLDYFSTGCRSIADACTSVGVSVEQVLEWISDFTVMAESDVRPPWLAMSLTTLCDEIETTHHVRERLLWDRVDPLLPRICAIHGDRDVRMAQLCELVAKLRSDRRGHHQREEQGLFPLIRQLDGELHAGGGQAEGGRIPTERCRASIEDRITQLIDEHVDAARLFGHLRQLTDDFRLRPDLCASHALLMHLLGEIERDSRLHMHRENHILFPAVTLASRVGEAGEDGEMNDATSMPRPAA